MTQPDLITIADSHVTHPAELQRLSGQCARILERLRTGPASNTELAAISLRFGARLFDLRKAGYQIDRIEWDHATGRTVYALRTGA